MPAASRVRASTASQRSPWTASTTVSTLMPVAMWWTNQTRVASDSSASAMAPVMARCGTNGLSCTVRTVRRTISA